MGFSTAYGQSPDKFGHQDYYAALGTGASNSDILNWLSSNTGLLAGVNVPGGGGLYDEIAQKVNSERAEQDAAAKRDAETKALIDSLKAQNQEVLGQIQASNQNVTNQIQTFQDSIKNQVSPTIDAVTNQLRTSFSPISVVDRKEASPNIFEEFLNSNPDQGSKEFGFSTAW